MGPTSPAGRLPESFPNDLAGSDADGSGHLTQAAWDDLCAAVHSCLDPSTSGSWTEPAGPASSFLALADLHGVSPLLASGSIPPVSGLAEGLERRAAETAAVSLSQVRELDEILLELEATGVPAVSFKGPVLSLLAFGDLGRRPSLDIDIVVPRTGVPAAVDVLRGRGYHAPDLDQMDVDRQLAVGREIGFVSPSGRIVEVQWAFAPPHDRLGLHPSKLRIERVAVGGLELSTFAPADLLVALGVHAARERWWRLLWLADVAGLIRSGVDWDRVTDVAERGWVARITKITLALTDRVLGVGAPSYLDRWIRSDPAVDAWVDRVMSAGGTLPQAPTAGTLLGLHDDRVADAAAAFRWLFTATGEDIRAVPLPRGLAPAYAVVRPLRLAARRFRGVGPA